MPALRSFRIVGAKAMARVSAACVCHSPLLILPFVTRPRRASTLATVVRCHLPPSLVGVSFRFISFASARWDKNRVAVSSRRVEANARARASAARLPAKAPSSPFLRDDVRPRAVFIGLSWLDFDCPATQRPRVKLSCDPRRHRSRKRRPVQRSHETGLWPAGTSAVRSIGAHQQEEARSPLRSCRTGEIPVAREQHTGGDPRCKSELPNANPDEGPVRTPLIAFHHSLRPEFDYD